ncbi:MAG: hypothetical protein D6741_07740, partial [Planctomycetota bacterium]
CGQGRLIVEEAIMRTTSGNSSATSEAGVVSKRRLAIAALLLVGVTVLGYGYFDHSRIGLFVGLVVVLAGVLNGIIQIVSSDDR